MATYADCGSCNATGFEAVVNGAIQFSNDILIKVCETSTTQLYYAIDLSYITFIYFDNSDTLKFSITIFQLMIYLDIFRCYNVIESLIKIHFQIPGNGQHK